MFEIRTLDDVRGNNVIIYSIKTLLERKSFPKLSIMSGVMGVGKTSVARIVADEIDESGVPVKTYNCGLLDDMTKLQEEVFSMTPMRPKAFIFEEFHTLNKTSQNTLLQMFDTQSPNTYVICTTTELSRILRTIRSRARVWEFKLLTEKQLGQLLDDYLKMQGVSLSTPARNTLLRSCKGVPRDLISNADFAIAGDFNSSQLDSLLGNVSDELLFTVLCTLKSRTIDFAQHIEELMDDASDNKLEALSDFWLRFLLERSSGTRMTLSSEMVTSLNKIFSDSDIQKVTKTILRATPSTLLLELINLNMILTSTTGSDTLGYQKDSAHSAESEARIQSQSIQARKAQISGKVTIGDVKGFQL